MQVSTPEDHLTHALVGGGESISMGVSDDAALMHILSTSLYTHPKLASVREIMCNGWDAHIAAGITDTPLHIELTPTKISVRDFGLGIHHDNIGKIYGTYGNSTKRDDSKSTGGFGLGSKAPFAYVDNFEVISNHQGVATVYRISKSSMERGGKPSINVVMQIPTTETGIKVSMDIKPGRDYEEFRALVNEVLILGGIKALINEATDPVAVLPLSESPTGYIIHSYTKQTIRGDSPIYIRYGNVVYPVPASADYETEYDYVVELMESIHHDRRIIFQCAPDSISIAPSREALQLNDTTVASIKAALMTIKESDLGKAENAAKMIKRENLNSYLTKVTDFNILSHLKGQDTIRMPSSTPYGANHPTGFYTFDYRRALLRHRLSQSDSRVEEWELNAKLIGELIRRGNYNSAYIKFLKDVQVSVVNYKKRHHTGDHPAWKHAVRYALSKVFIAFDKNPALNMDRVTLVKSAGYGNIDVSKFGHSEQWMTIHDAVKMAEKKAIIVRSRKDLKAYFMNSRYKSGIKGNYFCYTVTKKPESLIQARFELEEAGYKITEYLPEAETFKEAVEVDELGNVIPKVRKPAKKRVGYPTLAQSLDQEKPWHDAYYLLSKAREVSTATGESNPDPVAWVILNNKSEGAGSFGGWGRDGSKTVNQLFGKEVAVVTQVQADILTNKGVPELSEYVSNYVDETLAASPEFRRWLVFGAKAKDSHYTGNIPTELIKQMVTHPALMADLGLRFSISPETAMLVELSGSSTFLRSKKEGKVAAIVKQMTGKTHGDYEKTVKAINSSRWLKFINTSAVAEHLRDGARDTDDMQNAYELLTLIVKGKQAHVRLDPNRLPRG